MLTVGEALVALLADYGVELVFGVPGTHSIELYRGLASSSIRHISPRHEQGGGFMADGYARVSGKPGVCFVITGPGVTNISTPLGEAYIDSVPMLVISPVNDPGPDDYNRGRLHEITNQAAVTAPLTAFSATVTLAEEIPQLIARAFAVFASERPRPVHIHIPLSILPQTVGTAWHAEILPEPPRASEDDIDALRQMLAQAENPIMLIGGGTRGCSDEVLALAESIPCPVLCTAAARGVVPGSHNLSVGAQLRASYVQDLLQDADMALIVGSEVAQTDHWNDALELPAAQAWINLNPQAGREQAGALRIQADACDTLRRLCESLAPVLPDRLDNVLQLCAQARELQLRDLTPMESQHWAVLEQVVYATPQDATIVSDMTQISYTAVDFLPQERPNRWLHPCGYGTLGYALPAAIGAILADTTKSALVLVGDAGLQYTMQEMTLATELGFNLVVLLWNNNALQQIRDDMEGAGIVPVGVQQQNPDFLALAQSCGWRASKVESVEALGDALEGAFRTPGPVLLQLDQKS